MLKITIYKLQYVFQLFIGVSCIHVTITYIPISYTYIHECLYGIADRV